MPASAPTQPLDPAQRLRVLVIGSGGREHALALALARDPDVAAVHCAPGNTGTALVGRNHPVVATDPEGVAVLAAELGVDLVVVGPEGPLVAGVADAVRGVGIACFGPSRQAARLEGSKAFAKEVMAAAGLPTASARVCESAAEVTAALDEFGPPYVVKDDGLASGKGVVVTTDRQAALDHAASCDRVLIEEYLDGPEVSLFAVTDGTTVVPLQPAQDFKRAYDDDAGPNTGGMGAYTPLPWAPDDLAEQVQRTVLQPAIDELARRGSPFCGLLYAGLALSSKGIRVIEFNVRFGDPEAQPLLARLQTPLGGLLYAAATGTLHEHPPLAWSDESAVAVVLAAENYPAAPLTGGVIKGLDVAGSNGTMIIHAGIALDSQGRLINTGGRVLAVVGTGAELATARHAAYATIAGIELPGSFYRTDIAQRAAEDIAQRAAEDVAPRAAEQ